MTSWSRVMNATYLSGSRSSLDELAAQTGVPRGSVYHALAKLTGGGLVTRDSNGAFIVTPLTLEALQDGLTARCAIELGAATLTVGKVPADRLGELRRVVERSRPAAADDFDMNAHLGRYSAVQEEFVRLSDSPALLDAYRRVNAPAMIMSLTTARVVKRSADHLAAEDAFRHHLALLDAYEAGDLEAVNREIVHHINQTITYTRRHMDASGGQF